MNANGIAKALRWLAKEAEFVFAAEQLNDAAALIEQQRAELAELREATTGIPLPRLREICEAERDGRCVVLPCKVGRIKGAVDGLYESYGCIYGDIGLNHAYGDCRKGCYECIMGGLCDEAAMKGETHENTD